MTLNVNNLHSIDDIITVLQKLFYNFDNTSDTYYNMYLNTTEMDVTFKRYNSVGVLEEHTVPNIAKMRRMSFSSKGNPEGQIVADIGYLCIDTISGNLYYKASGTGSTGWIELWSATNLGPQGSNATNIYVAPDGDASNITNLNLDNAGSGTLSVMFGGTGGSGLTGIVKANGISPYSAAVDGVDYLGPLSMTGMICYYPVIFNNGKLKVPAGWLICDGSSYSTTDQARLFEVIGYTYGGSGSSFNVPNFLDKFIRCVNSTDSTTARSATNVQDSQNKQHVHNTGSLIISTVNAAHGHSASTNNTGSHYHGSMGENSDASPYGLYSASRNHWGTNGGLDQDNTTWRTSTDGAHSHTVTVNSANATHNHTLSGNTGSEGGTEARVINMPLVPIIKV